MTAPKAPCPNCGTTNWTHRLTIGTLDACNTCASKLESGVSADCRSALASSEIGTEGSAWPRFQESAPADPAATNTTTGKCCHQSVIVLDFTERVSVTYRRCPVHGETEHIYHPPRRLTLRRRWQLRQARRRLSKYAPVSVCGVPPGKTPT